MILWTPVKKGEDERIGSCVVAVGGWTPLLAVGEASKAFALGPTHATEGQR